MSIHLIKHIPFKIDVKNILHTFYTNPPQGHVNIIKELSHKASEIAQPKAVIAYEGIEKVTSKNISLAGTRFTSAILVKLLKKHQAAAPFIATAGHEIEEWSERDNDLVFKFWAGEIKKQILNSALEAAKSKLYYLSRWKKISFISPGSIDDWDLKEQEYIASLFTGHLKTMSIDINPYGILTPAYSLSGIFFECPDSSEMCTYCQSTTCIHRKTPAHIFLQK